MLLIRIVVAITTALLMQHAGARVTGDAHCEPSDLLIIPNTIYTLDNALPQADALAIRDGKIVFVGSLEDATHWRCGAQRVLELPTAYVYPGFTDGHQHLEGIGRRTRTLSLFGITTLAETVARIESWSKSVNEGEWILGRGWIEREWTDQQRFLSRHDVDGFSAEKPLYLPRADGVSALVNTRAIEIAGITSTTPDPPGGRFERDDSGELTGYILGTALDAFRAVLPSETDAYLKENLRRGMAVNAAMGWTQTHDAGMSLRLASLLRELHAEGQMAHRVYIAAPVAEAESLFEQGPEQSDDGLYVLRGIKVFIDGTLGSRGAALLEPYSDADTHGFMDRTSQEVLMPVLEQALRDGFQVMTHVIGDRALRQTLDWYEQAWSDLNRDEWASDDIRWRVEHAQVIPPVDQQRLADMAVLPSMQPSHAIGDLNFAPDRLGPERLKYAYPWQALLNRGLPIIAGSDAPVEVGDPRIEFFAAISRSRLDGSRGSGWHPELAVSREDALRMLTLWPAYGAFQEQERGSISVGKVADLTVFDTDFMTAKPSTILTAKTVMTLVGGRIMFSQDK